jgi:hypothetical protein
MDPIPWTGIIMIKIKISEDGSKVRRISNFVVLSFSVITDDLTLLSKDQNVFCIVNYKEDYDHLKLAWKTNICARDISRNSFKMI